MITKKEKGEIDIRWGSGAGMQDPNFEDLDYHGPYPGKFAEWIRQQIVEIQ